MQRAQSEITDVQKKVSQGSVLGPMLFIQLTNNLLNWLQGACHKVMYADDTVLISANESIEHIESKTNTTLNTTNALLRTWF